MVRRLGLLVLAVLLFSGLAFGVDPTVVTKIVRVGGTVPTDCDYTSLAAWEAGVKADLTEATGSNTIQVAKCETTGGADVSAVTFSASWKTDATHYIQVWTDPTDTGTGGGGAGGTHRHDGKYNTAAYRIEITSWTVCISCGSSGTANDIYIIGIQTKSTRTSGAGSALGINWYGTAPGDRRFFQNIIVGVLSGTATGIGLQIIYGTCYVENNIISGFAGGGASSGLTIGYSPTTGTHYIYNNTVVGCDIGYKRTYGTCTIKNCIACTCTDGYLGTWTTSATNLSDINGDAPSEVAYGAATFVGAADFHLGATDTKAINLGTDLSAVFAVDVDNVARPTGAGTWDIGVDEYVAPPAAPSTRKHRFVQVIR